MNVRSQRSAAWRLATLSGSVAVFFAFAGACGKKADSGSGDDVKANPKTTTSTTTGSSSGSSTGSTTGNPCLRLDEAGLEDGGFGTTTGGMDSSMTTGATTGGSNPASPSDQGGAGSTTGSAAPDASVGTVGGCNSGTAAGGTATSVGTSSGGTTSSNPTGTGTGGGTAWSPGPGISGCHDLKKAWVAVVNHGNGQCGDDEYTDLCCTDPNAFLNAFAAVKDKNGVFLKDSLQPSITAMQTAGLVFYGCSKSGDKISLLAAKYNGGSIAYQSVYVTGATPSLAGQPASCASKTLADIGYTDPGTTTGGSTGGAATGSTTGSTTGTTTAVPPAGLCGLTDTSQPGLRGWLNNAANYATYKHSANLVASLDGLQHSHGAKVRVSTNQVLTDSFTVNNAAHPACAMAVIEEYDSGGNRTGTALAIKYKAAAAADSWVYYQAEGANVAAPASEKYGVGADPCKTCHATPTVFKDYAFPAPN